MTNAETITKLNNALQTLIKAYEELQGDNNNLKQRVAELEDEVLNLELAKESLEGDLTSLKSNTEQDKTNIYSMLGKIEDLLNKKDDKLDFVSPVVRTEKKEGKKEEDTKDENEESIALDESENLLNSFENVLNKKDETKDDNKLDLTKMSSLLNGFHS
jgi:FtsZ-binding cell division protein ZapB